MSYKFIDQKPVYTIYMSTLDIHKRNNKHSTLNLSKKDMKIGFQELNFSNDALMQLKC